MFKFGPPYTARELFDRERELSVLVGALKALKKGVRRDYALVGVRRIGKTSLFNKLRTEAKASGLVPVLVDCEGLTLELFARTYGASVIDAFVESEGLAEKVKRKALEAVREGPSAAISALAEMSGRIESLGFKAARDYLEFSIKLREKQKKGPAGPAELFDYLEKTLNLPEQLGREYKKLFVVMLDEFQTTAAYSLGEQHFFAVMRRNTQRHERVSYFIAGSNIGMMKNIVLSPANPFGANFMVEWIKPFDAATSQLFLEKGFAKEKVRVAGEAVKKIVEFTGGHPAYLNWFGEKCVRLGKASLADVKMLEDEFLSPTGVGVFFEKELGRIRGATETHSTAILRAMAKNLGSPTLIAGEVGGITASNVINYLRRLEEYGYVQKNGRGSYGFVDPMLKKYLASSPA